MRVDMRITLSCVTAVSGALGCLASHAHAQTLPNGWQIDVEQPVLAPPGHASGLPQSTTITVRAKFDSATDYAFAAGVFDLVASEAGLAGENWSDNERIAPFDFAGSSDGTPTDTGAIDATPGQFHNPDLGFVGDPSNPAAVWRITYTATDFAPRLIDLDTRTDAGPKGFVLFDDPDAGTSRRVDPSMLMEGSGQIEIIPAPGVLALALPAGLAMTRRRR
ncbi:MAG: hypothetical protein ACIAS6_05295 [Phycisphaerales bacterium JB060]